MSGPAADSSERPPAPVPVLEPGHTYATVTDQLSAIVLTGRTPRSWWIAFAASFTLLMAGHGRCVSTAMMLGDRDYALWQLARAQAMADPELCRVAARLFAWLDEPGSRLADSARRL